MPTIREILGDKYTTELETALGDVANQSFLADDGSFIPKANAQGEKLRLEGIISESNKKIQQLEREKLSPEQLAELIAQESAAERALYGKKLAELNLKSGISSTGITLDDESIELIAGDDPVRSEKVSARLAKLITDAKAAGVAEANKQHLTNNSAPQGNINNTSELSAAQSKLDEALKSGDQAQIMYWTNKVFNINKKE